MKFTKTIAAALFVAVTATSAMAAGGYASVEYYDESNRATGKENIKEALTVGTKEGAVDYSIKMENSQTEIGNGSISQGIEIRVKKSFDGFYVGGRLGEKITNTDHFSHYAVDAGYKFPLFAGLTADVGARYRNAFESKKLFETTRAHVAVGYALTKQDAVAVRWSRSWGDEEKDAVRLQYTRSF
jgi:hypothetical protein